MAFSPGRGVRAAAQRPMAAGDHHAGRDGDRRASAGITVGARMSQQVWGVGPCVCGEGEIFFVAAPGGREEQFPHAHHLGQGSGGGKL